MYTLQVVPAIRFVPEVVVVGPDPVTGLLTREFTLYFGMGGNDDESATGGGYTNGAVGVVRVNDPIETLPVC